MAGSPAPRSRALRICGYLFLAVATYLVALWQMLPYEEVGRRVEQALGTHGVGSEIAGLGPAALFGCAADRLSLFPPEQPELRWELTDLQLRPLPRRLLTGERAVALRGRFLGGRVDATTLWEQPPRVEAAWQDLLLAQLPLPPAASELPLAGRVSGTLQAAAEPTNLIRADATLLAQLRDVAIGAGTVQGIPVPAVRLGDGTLRVRTADGKMEIEAAEFKNGDLEISFTGSLILREDLTRSLVNGMLSLRPNQQAAKDLGLLFALFPGPKGSDGRYTARVRGSLGAPRLLKR